MATSQTGSAMINFVTSSTTTTNSRGITQIITPQGTNLAIVKMKIPFQKRVSQGSKRFLFFLAEQPAYLPNVNQKVLIHHTNLGTATSLNNYFTTQFTNVAVGSYVRLAIMGGSGQGATPPAARDGFTYAFDASYDDDINGNNELGYIAGDCDGMIEYEVSPTNYEILKPIESNVIVTERVPYDQSEGDNYLRGTSTGDAQAVLDIAPMLFVDRDASTTVFSNLYKSFNLPVTTIEQSEFIQSTLGFWTDSTAGTLYYNGKQGYWTAGGAANMVHPVTGYTGTFFGTAYQHLNQTRILVMEIPQAQYGEIIDGKTLKIQIPKSGGTTFYACYGAYCANPKEYALGKMDNYMSEHDMIAAYFGNPAALGSPNISSYESNVVLLFCDDIATPYSGGSWATGHEEVMQGEKVYNSTSVVSKKFFDLYNDRPVGIAYLDRGFVVITDPTMIDAVYDICFDSSRNPLNVRSAANIIRNFDGVTLDYYNSQFLFKSDYVTGSTTNHFAEYLSYNTEKSINIVCLASANEFYRTTNITAKVLDNATDQDFAELKDPISGNLYPIVITEIGLHDSQGNLLAIVKPSEPIKKYWYDVVSFNIKIRL